MGLPQTQLREAEEEVLANVPGVVIMVKVKADDIAIVWVGVQLDRSVRNVQPSGGGRRRGRNVQMMQHEDANEADPPVQEPDYQRGQHPAVQV